MGELQQPDIPKLTETIVTTETPPFSSPESLVFNSDKVVVIGCSKNRQLWQDVGKELSKIDGGEVTVFDTTVKEFANYEIKVQMPVNLRGRHVFILAAPSGKDLHTDLFELFFAIYAAKTASADEITVLVPCMPYARQDRKDEPRTAGSAKVIDMILETLGADRISTIDLHSAQQQLFVDIPWDNVFASHLLLPEIEKVVGEKPITVLSPDAGGLPRADWYSKHLENAIPAAAYKKHPVDKVNVTETLGIMGNVKDRMIIIPDDIGDTFGSMVKAAEAARDEGADEEIIGLVTHGYFDGDALDKLTNSPIKKLFVMDTLELSEEVRNHPKIHVVSSAPLIAEVIKRIQTGESISKDLIQ